MVTTAELPTRLETRLDRVKPPIPQPRTTTFGSEGKGFPDSKVWLFSTA